MRSWRVRSRSRWRTARVRVPARLASPSARGTPPDFPAAGQKLTITYNVTVTDNNGASSTQPVTITVIGTNDAPVLAADASGPHTITNHAPPPGIITPDTSTGALAFTDVDLSDTHKSTTSTPTFAWSG